MNVDISCQLLSNKEFLLLERYLIKRKVGEGTFGSVYLAVDRVSNSPVAVKIEDPSDKKGSRYYLEFESTVHKSVGKHTGFARFVDFERTPSGCLLAMECLGPNLGELFSECDGIFSLSTVFSIGYQLLSVLEVFHSYGVLHRDIKPENIVCGVHDTGKVFLVDFGTAGRFLKNGEHIPMESGKQAIGTPKFASLNVHEHLTPSRRDDIESLAYVLIFFAVGHLPWNGKPQSEMKRLKQTFEMKGIPSTVFFSLSKQKKNQNNIICR